MIVKKIISFLFIIPFFLFIIPFFLIYIGVINFDNSDVVIDSYIANISIDESGDMTVVEEWNMNYNEIMTVRFRDIVLNKYAKDYPLYMDVNNKAFLDTTNVSVKYYKNGFDRSENIRVGYSWEGDLDELGYPVVCEPNIPTCESIFVNTILAGRMSGDVTFIYEYTINGAVTKYSDISELNWRMFTYAEGTVEHAEISIVLPENDYDLSNLYAWGHGLTDGTISIISNNRIEMEMSNIKDGEFPEFRILMENDLFPNIRESNIVINEAINKSVILDYESDLANYYNFQVSLANIMLYSSFGLVVLMMVIGIVIYFKYDKEYTASFDNDYFRELPSDDTPATLSYLYYMEKIVDETITATLLDLIRRKYIDLQNAESNMSSSSSNFNLVYNKEKSHDELKEYESDFLNYIFNTIGNGDFVTTKQIENYGSVSESKAISYQNFLKRFIRLAKRDGKSKKYFEVGISNKKRIMLFSNSIPLLFILINIIAFSLFNINIFIPILISVALMVFLSAYVYGIDKRSINGNEMFAKWKAFRNFLLSFGNLEDYPIPGIIVWEHYLVYATVLGVADQVVSQLSVKLPESDIDESESTYLYKDYRRGRIPYWGYHHRFNQAFSLAKMNAKSTIIEARNARASSRGSGGGFSGGSSFGGGGGGGRSR
ncbi:MAG: DUF2207 domain-containing protein [Candidatus Izemoplasmatales bacterium]|jgi:uncharacterized membrane protein|nr:DUF2207 domain-containing protein [Candidatus Izemoplasmatales bacterium]